MHVFAKITPEARAFPVSARNIAQLCDADRHIKSPLIDQIRSVTYITTNGPTETLAPGR